MSTDKTDPKPKDEKISSADDQTTKKADVELNEKELGKVAGGVRESGRDPSTY